MMQHTAILDNRVYHLHTINDRFVRVERRIASYGALVTELDSVVEYGKHDTIRMIIERAYHKQSKRAN